MFPVEAVIPQIRASLERNRDVVLRAPPGSGKTTCVPPALLDAPFLKGKKILMLEPRRLAARSCAAYIARKMGERRECGRDGRLSGAPGAEGVCPHEA